MITSDVKRALAKGKNRVFIKQLCGAEHRLSELCEDVERIASGLVETFGSCDRLVIGVAMRSSYEWVATMFAIMQVKAVLLPVPIEFSDDQIGSLLGKASAIFVGDDATRIRIEKILPGAICLTANSPKTTGRRQDAGERIEKGVVAIIHTSGTTSKPKGVKIRDEAVGVLVANVLKRTPQRPLNYLSIVPMSLLIEQVLGVFLPLLTEGSLTLMPEGVPEYGARSAGASGYLEMIAQANPDFLYLPPKLLEEADRLLGEEGSASRLFGANHPHIITGGAKVPIGVLQSLDRKGVDIYEAYGLSENSSIISLNYPGRRRIGSAGPLLDGIEPKFVNGELLVKTPTLCAGYYNTDDTSCEISDGYLHTGDIAEIRDGYLYITGRKKHVIILSTARNISPEWVETVYKESPLIDDMIVIGESREEPAAIVLSASPEKDVIADMRTRDHHLADFSRVHRILIISDIDRFRINYYTVTGRPRRSVIEEQFAPQLYE
jgi:long-chain acyl-CoA synthetase